ncbi:MAG: hypothetical protein D6718_01875 [Acidobacteria bacterium]|nr:MAG: hypothetical protein D6718_01875 [Acidobacteriota bacterium]
MTRRIPVFLAALAALPAMPAWAATSRSWERSGAAFRAGTFEGTVLAPDGHLRAGPRERELARPPSAVVWDLLVTRKAVWIAAGDGAGLWVVPRDGGPARVVSGLGEAPEVLALAAGQNAVYAATGPRGAIYRIAPDGSSAVEIARPDAEYIWDLAVGSDGALLAATGLPGRVLRIPPGKPPRELWRTSEAHVRCLAVGAGRAVWAGTSDSGWVVRIDGGGSAFVVYDSERPEVADLAIAADGTVWAALAGSAAERSREERTGSTAASASVTVTPKKDDERAKKKERSGRLPAGGGALVRIPRNGEPSELWRDSKETPLSVLPTTGGGVLLATGGEGRVFWIGRDGGEGLWLARRDARAVSALAAGGAAIAAATSNPAIVSIFGPDTARPARWVSDVIDLGVRARSGRVAATVPEGASRGIAVEIRVGNTKEPGPGWSGWRKLDDAAGPPGHNGQAADLPLARFVQVAVEFGRAAEQDASVARIEGRYRPLNRPPRIKNVQVLPPGVAYRPIPPSTVTGGEEPVVRQPVPEAQRGELEAKRRGWRSKRAWEPGALTLRWEAADPDGDGLLYRIDACRDVGGPCTRWFPLARDLERTFFSFDARGFEDGVYRFRVTASDAPANYAGAALESSEVTGPVRLDTVPPVIDRLRVAEEDGGITIEIEAHDRDGRVALAEVAGSSGRWIPIEPVDGVEDGERETFRARLEESGERPLAVRVIDAAGNVAAREWIPGRQSTAR